jgi:hypothetical protein
VYSTCWKGAPSSSACVDVDIATGVVEVAIVKSFKNADCVEHREKSVEKMAGYLVSRAFYNSRRVPES